MGIDALAELDDDPFEGADGVAGAHDTTMNARLARIAGREFGTLIFLDSDGSTVRFNI
jgi:hypothetical protein